MACRLALFRSRMGKRLTRGRKRRIFAALAKPQRMSRPGANQKHCITGQSKSKACSQTSPKPPSRGPRGVQIWRLQGGIPPHQRSRPRPSILGNPRRCRDPASPFYLHPLIDMAESRENLADSVADEPRRCLATNCPRGRRVLARLWRRRRDLGANLPL